MNSFLRFEAAFLSRIDPEKCTYVNENAKIYGVCLRKFKIHPNTRVWRRKAVIYIKVQTRRLQVEPFKSHNSSRPDIGVNSNLRKF